MWREYGVPHQGTTPLICTRDDGWKETDDGYAIQLSQYHTLLDSTTKMMAEINQNFTSPDSPRQLNLPPRMMQGINSDMKTQSLEALLKLETVFTEAQEYVERLLIADIFPRFVRHQMTLSATRALAGDRSKYQGLGDCFCLTDPA